MCSGVSSGGKDEMVKTLWSAHAGVTGQMCAEVNRRGTGT